MHMAGLSRKKTNGLYDTPVPQFLLHYPTYHENHTRGLRARECIGVGEEVMHSECWSAVGCRVGRQWWCTREPRKSEDEEFRVNRVCLQPRKAWRSQYGRCRSLTCTLSYSNVSQADSLTTIIMLHLSKFIELWWLYIVRICLTLAKGKKY